MCSIVDESWESPVACSAWCCWCPVSNLGSDNLIDSRPHRSRCTLADIRGLCEIQLRWFQFTLRCNLAVGMGHSWATDLSDLILVGPDHHTRGHTMSALFLWKGRCDYLPEPSAAFIKERYHLASKILMENPHLSTSTSQWINAMTQIIKSSQSAERVTQTNVICNRLHHFLLKWYSEPDLMLLLLHAMIHRRSSREKHYVAVRDETCGDIASANRQATSTFFSLISSVNGSSLLLMPKVFWHLWRHVSSS